MSELFDEIMDGEGAYEEVKPYHAVKDKPEEVVLDWLKKTAQVIQKDNRDRHYIQRSNLASYRGIQYGPSSTRTGAYRDPEKLATNKLSKFTVNHLYDITETRIAQITRMKPAVDVLPATDEFTDKNAAKATSKLLKHLWYLNDVDALLRKMTKYKFIFGEGYLFVTWDPSKGDIHPDFVPGMELLDEQGQPTGQIVKEPVMTGDLQYDVEVPWRVLVEPCQEFSECKYLFRIKSVHVEDLKKDYPKHKEKLTATSDLSLYDMEILETRKLKDHAVVYEFYHIKNKHCPEGAYIKFVDDVILEKGKHPFNHGKLPVIRLTDIDIPDMLHGISFYEQIKPIQNMHNNLSTMLAKNIYLMGHAKWVMPRGACKIESLGNDNTIVQYQGPVAPSLLQTSPNPPEAYRFRDSLKEEMEQVSGVSGVSRGQPPSGITAAVALQFLNEQESERANSHIAKHNTMIEQVARMSIAVAGDYYQPNDGRMIRIMGKDDAESVEAFDSANLSKSYDVRVKGGNALPEQKSARIQRIIELIQYKPDAIPNEQLVELLEFGNVEKFQSVLTEAVRSAEAENEEMLQGKAVSEPMEYEDQITHWRVHVQAIQKKSFKDKVPPAIQDAMIDHIETHEFQMIEQAKENPLFESKLAQLELFPIFYKADDFKPVSAEQKAVEAQGAANRGEPSSTEIAATEAPPIQRQ